MTTADILCFINSPVYSIIDLLSWVIELVDELLHSCSIVTNSITNNTVDLLDLSQSVSSSGLCSSYQQINSAQVNKLHNITAELRTILKGHTIIIPSICRENNVVSSNQAEISADTLTLENKREEYKDLVYMPGHSPEKEENTLFLENKSEENKDLVYMPGHSPVKAENTPNQRINRETLNTIINETDVVKRSTRYLYYLCMQYAISNKELPNFEDYRHHYRIEAGTGEETETNVKRLKYIWDKNINRMNNYIHGGIKERIDKLEEILKNITSQEEIHQLRNQYSSFSRNIYSRDVAAAALWISATLTNHKYLEMKKWTAVTASNINRNKELTAPMISLELYLNKLKEKGILNNSCDHKKAKALREILIHLGWIECIDNSYDFIQAHRSMRYILTKKHPYYKEFEQVIGSDTIHYWKNITKQQNKNYA